MSFNQQRVKTHSMRYFKNADRLLTTYAEELQAISKLTTLHCQATCNAGVLAVAHALHASPLSNMQVMGIMEEQQLQELLHISKRRVNDKLGMALRLLEERKERKRIQATQIREGTAFVRRVLWSNLNAIPWLAGYENLVNQQYFAEMICTGGRRQVAIHMYHHFHSQTPSALSRNGNYIPYVLCSGSGKNHLALKFWAQGLWA